MQPNAFSGFNPLLQAYSLEDTVKNKYFERAVLADAALEAINQIPFTHVDANKKPLWQSKFPAFRAAVLAEYRHIRAKLQPDNIDKITSNTQWRTDFKALKWLDEYSKQVPSDANAQEPLESLFKRFVDAHSSIWDFLEADGVTKYEHSMPDLGSIMLQRN